MFSIKKYDGCNYQLLCDDNVVGYFKLLYTGWHFDYSQIISSRTNSNIFSFILKTLENLNNGVVYE